MKVLITGGAGFVGSRLALAFKIWRIGKAGSGYSFAAGPNLNRRAA